MQSYKTAENKGSRYGDLITLKNNNSNKSNHIYLWRLEEKCMIPPRKGYMKKKKTHPENQYIENSARKYFQKHEGLLVVTINNCFCLKDGKRWVGRENSPSQIIFVNRKSPK